MPPMMVSIDRAGRIVVPREIRDQLGLDPGVDLELTLVGEAIHLTPKRRLRRVVAGDDGWPVVEAGDSTTTDADVQRWRDADQR